MTISNECGVRQGVFSGFPRNSGYGFSVHLNAGAVGTKITMRRRDATTRARGLTLIELLAVIAGLALLLSILLPAVSSARTEADRLGCKNHLYRMGLAFNSHMQDKDGYLPLARPLDSPVPCRTPAPPLTVALLGHYRPTINIYTCPGDSGELYTHCNMSYWYNEVASGKRIEDLLDRRKGIISPQMVPLVWDADAVTFETPEIVLKVPRFHVVRQAMFADMHIDTLSDSYTSMDPLR